MTVPFTQRRQTFHNHGDMMMINRRTALQYLATAPGAHLVASHAQEAAFPTKPIRILAASAPGALIDQATRLYADRMAVFLKQPVLVENHAGASSLIAARQLFKSAPDGHVLMTSANTMVSVPLLNSGAGYAVKDFSAVGELARSPVLLFVSSTSPFKSLADLVAAAKQSPGQLTYGSGGIGTTNHLPVELFAKQAGLRFTHVPYKGIALAVPDVLGGRVNFMMGTATATAELIKTGALRVLAITSEKRSPKFPEVPTFAELGYRNANFEIWIGMVGPTGLPRSVTSRLANALEFARAEPDIHARLEAAGQTISGVRTPDQFAAVLRDEEEKFRRVIKDANLVVSRSHDAAPAAPHTGRLV